MLKVRVTRRYFHEGSWIGPSEVWMFESSRCQEAFDLYGEMSKLGPSVVIDIDVVDVCDCGS